MANRKNPDDQPAPAPEPEPTPDPVVPETPAAEAPAGPSPEERLKALEEALSRANWTIARQAVDLAHAAENAGLLEKSREKVKRLKDRHIDAKEEAAAAKKAYDAALEGHLDLERDLLTGQGRLPFPPPDAPPADGHAAEPTVTFGDGRVTPATAVARALPSVDAEAAGDASWRQVPLGTLGVADELPHAIVARLEDAGIVTVGDLADFVRPAPSGYCKRLVDIDGIGESKAAKIEAALDAFWKNWSAWQARTAAEAAAPARGEDPIDVEFEEADDPAPFDPPADDDPGADDDDDQDDDGGA